MKVAAALLAAVILLWLAAPRVVYIGIGGALGFFVIPQLILLMCGFGPFGLLKFSLAWLYQEAFVGDAAPPVIFAVLQEWGASGMPVKARMVVCVFCCVTIALVTCPEKSDCKAIIVADQCPQENPCGTRPRSMTECLDVLRDLSIAIEELTGILEKYYYRFRSALEHLGVIHV